MFVCRYHPNESQRTVAADDLGAKDDYDGLGYYGNSQAEGWHAMNWDCCGSEDPKALGCLFAAHVSYDDDP